MKHKKILNIVLSGCFIAIGWVLPFLTGQIREIGNMLCPMHFPVFIAAFLLGPWYALVIGIIIPITRSLIFGMPVLFPNAVCMSIELGVYGLVSGLVFNYFLKHYRKNKKELLITTLISLISAMIIGRVIWGLSRMAATLIPGTKYSFSAFLSGAILTAWPGMILQLILIPLFVLSCSKMFMITEPTLDKVEIDDNN